MNDSHLLFFKTVCLISWYLLIFQKTVNSLIFFTESNVFTPERHPFQTHLSLEHEPPLTPLSSHVQALCRRSHWRGNINWYNTLSDKNLSDQIFVTQQNFRDFSPKNFCPVSSTLYLLCHSCLLFVCVQPEDHY